MQVTLTKDYVQEECCNCGVVFFMTSALNNNLQKTKRTFYCPNGHAQSYTKSTADILRERLDQKDNEISRLQNQVRLLEKPKNKKKK